MRAIFIAVVVSLVGCAPVQMRSQIDRPIGDSYVSAGDIVARVQRTDDLPNVLGRADLFGRTRDRGFTEVRYMGLNPSGMPMFRRRDVDIMTNESTMSRTGGFSSFHAQGAAHQAFGGGSAQFNAVGTRYAAPTGRVVTIGQNGFEIIDASPAGLKYRAY